MRLFDLFRGPHEARLRFGADPVGRVRERLGRCPFTPVPTVGYPGSVTICDGFHPVTEVTADDRGRIAIGKAGVHGNDRYAVATNDDGYILLVPLASIPKRELLIWENSELKASLFRGLAEAAEGDVRPLDWVTADIAIDEDDGTE